MAYQLTPPHQDYSDLASGRVLFGAPGQAVFPVRLVSEIFLRCLAIRQKQGLHSPVTMYDPCCGTAYHLSACAFLHWPHIRAIIGSDVDPAMLSFAARNLDLLTAAGLAARRAEIEALHSHYGKASHAEALQSARHLQQQLVQNLAHHAVGTHLFQANVWQPEELKQELREQCPDVVITDVPYGRRSQWQGRVEDVTTVAGDSESPLSAGIPADPLWQMLDSLLAVLPTHALVAIAVDKSQMCNHERYIRRAKFQIGKRRIFLLQPDHGKI